MPSLKDSIAQLAESFATQVLAAIRTASLDDIAALAGGRARVAAATGGGRASSSAPAAARGGGRRGGGGRRRRSADEIAALGEQIASLLAGKPEGLRAEQIRSELGVARKELPRVITELLSSGAIRKEGQKRATTYFAGSGGGSGRGGAKRGGKRGGKRRGKKSAG
jgi:CRP-like cAMP-binding protein